MSCGGQQNTKAGCWSTPNARTYSHRDGGMESGGTGAVGYSSEYSVLQLKQLYGVASSISNTNKPTFLATMQLTHHVEGHMALMWTCILTRGKQGREGEFHRFCSYITTFNQSKQLRQRLSSSKVITFEILKELRTVLSSILHAVIASHQLDVEQARGCYKDGEAYSIEWWNREALFESCQGHSL